MWNILNKYFLFAAVYRVCFFEPVQAACGTPPLIVNAHVVGVKVIYEPGEEAVYSCNVGYMGIGRNRIVCPKNARWNKPGIKCEPKPCPIPQVLENGMMHSTEFKFGKTVYYSCNEGYILRGKNSSYCQSDTMWSDLQRSCEPVRCSPPTLPMYGSIKFSNPHGATDIPVFGESVTYSCNQGLALIGNETSFCLASGKWSQAPVCKEVKCPSPQKIVNGFLVFALKRNYNYLESVQYGCVQNYVLDGSRDVTCQKSGNWTHVPVCRAACILSVNRARIFYKGKKLWIKNLPSKRVQHREMVAFYCEDKKHNCGYPVLTQCIDGKIEAPSCFQEPSAAAYMFNWKLPSEITQC
uniref:Beta-2-glycoprotein 1 n=1 Tax=Callorhinchus milii TaxID=7868 RepID=A0A4W3K136_CALMI|eukprot:gi/632943404/ref/XP_007886930.1/ PREDICTED: beta-2-glycoprotein 1 [Callorhinchus milii]